MAIKDKKAGEKLLSIWWFIVLVVVALGIVAGVYLHYDAKIDLRKTEATLLSNELSECLIQGTDLLDGFLSDEFDIFQSCGLSENVLDKSGEFYFRVSFYSNQGELIKEIDKGRNSFEGDCNVIYDGNVELVKAEEFPKCFFLNRRVSSGNLEILTASNQRGEVKNAA